MDERKYSDKQIVAFIKGWTKAAITYPAFWLASRGIGTKLWRSAQFVRENNALMSMWDCYTDFGTRPKDDIQENEWDRIEHLQKSINILSDAIQNLSYEVFRFKD